MDCIVHWVAKSRTRLSDLHFDCKRGFSKRETRDSYTYCIPLQDFSRDRNRRECTKQEGNEKALSCWTAGWKHRPTPARRPLAHMSQAAEGVGPG